LNHPLPDLQAGHGLAFAPQNPQHVVLRRCQTVFPEQPPEAVLELVARPEDVQNRFLLRKLERLFFLEFGLQTALAHR
jgi:hypothetical protein